VPASPEIRTDEPPRPSALLELRDDPSSRARFLRMMGGGAAATTFSLALAACGKKKTGGNQFGGAGVGTAQFGQGDAGIVNFALALEYLEADFYRRALASGNLDGRALELAKRFGAEEQAHVVTLEGTVKNLGGKPAPKPRTSFTLDSRNIILITMNQLESVGVAAYLGQLDRIESKQVLAAALSIHTVEARHAAAISVLLGEPISPEGAFARSITSVEVLQQIRPFTSG
jgi:hypothetical protein